MRTKFGGGTGHSGSETFQTGQTYNIDTGLGNNLNHFYLWGRHSNGVRSVVEYDKTRPTQYVSLSYNLERWVGSAQTTIGSAPTQAPLQVNSVSNGVVNITVINTYGSSYFPEDVHWIAD